MPIQGPPGTGKTYTGARMIVELLKEGRKVGITATAHKAITNLVDELCVAAREESVDARIVQRGEEEEASSAAEVTVAGKNGDVVDGLLDSTFNVAAGTSWLWLMPVPHEQNSARSPEEAIRVVETVAALLGRPWTNQEGVIRRLTLDDILIVAPYNLQVGEISRRLQERFDDRGRVGTVDKFQGQEGALVLYSTATSSQDDAPRNMEFLYSRNRLNVAISRARALAIVVCNPGLFRIACRTPEEMRMANSFCLFREHSA